MSKITALVVLYGLAIVAICFVTWLDRKKP